MQPQQLVAIAKQWIEAFNGHHLDKLVALYDVNCVHVSPKLKVARPETKGIVSGHSALRDWFAASFAKFPGTSLTYTEHSITADTNRVWLEYIRRAKETEMVGTGTSATPVVKDTVMMVAEVFEVNAAGKIAKSRVYHGEMMS